MFLDLFYALREEGLAVTPGDWLTLLEALSLDLHESSFDAFYQVARCIVVRRLSDYDAFDRAFSRIFSGVVDDHLDILEQLEDWLRDPQRLEHLDPRLLEALRHLDLDELRRQFQDRLDRQKERHAGGNQWIGTGGTSPFGQGGAHPTGVRIGGRGGGRSALAVADARRFRDYRRDVVLDTRQMAAALRRLRRVGTSGAEEELDLDGTIDRTARHGGDLEVVMKPPRKNSVRVVLLMDVGGSMDPHAKLVSQLFSAAHQGGGFRELRSYYFHNCVYGKVYEDAGFTKPVATEELMAQLEPTWRLILVGDAYMHPGELTMSSGSWWDLQRGPTGFTWLARLAERFPLAAWMNPEPPRIWAAPTIAEIRRLFAMFPLTLGGLADLVEHMRRTPAASHRAYVHAAAQDLV